MKDPPNMVRTSWFSRERLLSHVDGGPAEESEAFVHTIYEQRNADLPSDRNDTPGRWIGYNSSQQRQNNVAGEVI